MKRPSAARSNPKGSPVLLPAALPANKAAAIIETASTPQGTAGPGFSSAVRTAPITAEASMSQVAILVEPEGRYGSNGTCPPPASRSTETAAWPRGSAIPRMPRRARI